MIIFIFRIAFSDVLQVVRQSSDQGSEEELLVRPALPQGEIVSVAANENQAMFITDNGRLWGVGLNVTRSGDNSFDPWYRSVPARQPGIDDARQVIYFNNTFIVLYNESSFLTYEEVTGSGVKATLLQLVGRQAENITRVELIDGGFGRAVVVTKQAIFVAGACANSTCGVVTSKQQINFTEIETPFNTALVKRVDCNEFQITFYLKGNAVYTTGPSGDWYCSNSEGQAADVAIHQVSSYAQRYYGRCDATSCSANRNSSVLLIDGVLHVCSGGKHPTTLPFLGYFTDWAPRLYVQDEKVVLCDQAGKPISVKSVQEKTRVLRRGSAMTYNQPLASDEEEGAAKKLGTLLGIAVACLVALGLIVVVLWLGLKRRRTQESTFMPTSLVKW